MGRYKSVIDEAPFPQFISKEMAGTLPPLPVPALASTLQRYLRSW